jgi:hypothetical protein
MKFWPALLAALMIHAPARGETAATDGETPPEWARGYEWAQENAVTDPAVCNTESQDFNDGCRAFAAEAGDPGSTQGIIRTYEFDEHIDNILE